MAISTLSKITVPLASDSSSSTQGLLMPKLQYRFRVTLENFGVSTPTTELTKQVIDVTRPTVNFEELEKIVSHSKLLISCHGAISHVASAYNIKQIDIIDINSKEPYSNWTDHFRNYSSIYRENFPNLSYKILNNDYFSQI